MARTIEDDSPRVPASQFVLAIACVVFVVCLLLGSIIFDGLGLFWCRLVSMGICAAYLVIWCVRDVRLLAGTASGEAGAVRSDRASGRRGRIGLGVELAVMALGAVLLAGICLGCLMDLPHLSSPSVARLSYVDCGMGGTRRGPITITLTGIDDETGEEVSFVASNRNANDFDAVRQADSVYVTSSATVRYLPNSRVVLSADFYAG